MKPRRRICASIALTILCTVRMQGGAEAADLAHLNCVAGPIKEPLVSPCGTYTGAMTITAWSLLQLKVIRRCRTTSLIAWGPKGFELHGEGTGKKEFTDAAFEDLKGLSETDILKLHNEAAQVGTRN